MVRVRSSRRVAGLKPGDYDHEIGLVDHDEADDASPSPPSFSVNTQQNASLDYDHLSRQFRDGEDGEPQEPSEDCPHPSMQPSIEVQAATPDVFSDSPHRIMPKRPQDTRETAIDIMYENERGGFLCGVPLFSSAALGGLDPPAWTNAYHKSSPTNIHTAVVPDPSWEWVWPEWRINHQDGVDQGGWEYSFAFSRKFSWHKAKWWNSFVRRRVWIRKRARRKGSDTNSSASLLNSNYFAIRPASHHGHRQSIGSLASSQVPSKSSLTRSPSMSLKEVIEDPIENDNICALLNVLRSSRIDREKREAVENYLEHADDLSDLQNEMQEIMSTFVYQASRKQLLSHLTYKYDEITRKLEQENQKDDTELLKRQDALRAVIERANEEAGKLVYWSDVRQVAEQGDLRVSVDGDPGWYDSHPGLDCSGPTEPNRGKLHGSK